LSSKREREREIEREREREREMEEKKRKEEKRRGQDAWEENEASGGWVLTGNPIGNRGRALEDNHDLTSGVIITHITLTSMKSRVGLGCPESKWFLGGGLPWVS